MAKPKSQGALAKAREAARVHARQAALTTRQAMVRKAADWVRGQDPEILTDLTEVGLIRREWLEGDDAPFSDAPPMTVLTRALEALVDRKPSALSQLGLSTLQVLATADSDDDSTAQRLTVLFTDLAGFTAYTEANGDDAARELLQRYYLRAGRVVRTRNGRIVKRLGDGLLATFPDPLAGVRAAVELSESPPDPLHIRAGMHTGDVLVESDDVAGHTVNVASRVAEEAAGGEVLATTATVAEIGPLPDDVHADAPRTHDLKGISHPVVVQQLHLNRPPDIDGATTSD